MKFKFLKYISKDKNEILFAQIALAVILTMTVVFIDNAFRQNSQSADNSTQASLLINFEDKQRLFEGTVTSDMTMLDALNAATAAGHIKLKYAAGKDNKVDVMEINDHINHTAGKSFLFYLNGGKIDAQNINRILIKTGDIIEIKFVPN